MHPRYKTKQIFYKVGEKIELEIQVMGIKFECCE